MWDREERYSNVTPDYCRSACGLSVCASCPRPKLLAEVVPGVLAYRAVNTQWRIGPAGYPTGLAYADCLAMLERQAPNIAEQSGLELPMPELLEDVQTIERAMLEAYAEQARATAQAQGAY